jgi:hypothetical protein
MYYRILMKNTRFFNYNGNLSCSKTSLHLLVDSLNNFSSHVDAIYDNLYPIRSAKFVWPIPHRHPVGN